jgi:hypothetical protein
MVLPVSSLPGLVWSINKGATKATEGSVPAQPVGHGSASTNVSYGQYGSGEGGGAELPFQIWPWLVLA